MSNITTYKSPGITFSESRLPTYSEVGARVDDLFQNLLTGELFACQDETFGNQVWMGSQGTVVQLILDILSPLYPDLIAMYTMDNIITTTLVDETANNYDGTITGAISVAGKIGNALSFDGTNDKVELPFTGSSLSQGAVSVWGISSTLVDLVSRSTTLNNNNFISLQMSNSGWLEVQARNVGGTFFGVRGSTPHTPGELTHIVFQSNGTAWEIYRNGVLETLTPIGGGNTGDWFGDLGVDNIVLGARVGSSIDYSQTTIDQTRFFNRPLTQAEITELYNEPPAPAILATDHPDLVAMYTMDNIVGNTIVDETGNGFDAVHTTSVLTTAGKIGNALLTNTNGSGNAIAPNVLTIADTQGAICFWCKYTGSTGWMDNVRVIGFSPSTIRLEASPTALYCYIIKRSGLYNDIRIDTSLLDGAFHLVVLQSTGSGYQCYIDGVGKTINMTRGTNNGSWWDQLNVGEIDQDGDIHLGTNQWDGVTDQVRYFNRALTQAEVTELYNEGA